MCMIPVDRNTHSEYVILLAFLLQQWSHEIALVYTAFLVKYDTICDSIPEIPPECSTVYMYGLASRFDYPSLSFVTSLLNRGIQIGEKSKLHRLMLFAKCTMCADSLHFLHLLLVAI